MENERKITQKQEGALRPIIETCSKINEFLRSQIIPQFEEKQARAKVFSEKLATKIHDGQKITQEDLGAFKKIQDSIIVELIDFVQGIQDNLFTEGDVLLNSLVGICTHNITHLIASRFEEYADKLKDYLDIQENEQAIENIPVFDALTISDIEINPENFTPRKDDLSEVFADLDYYYKHDKHSFKQRPNITLEVKRPNEKIEIDHFLGLTIESINELIRNAIDAMPNGGTIKIGAEKQGDSVVITITDTGEGIIQENLQKIFEDGFTTKMQGTGKGLFLLKEYFEKVLSGKVDIISEVGKGTSINITLPVLKK